jgi:uncharacterized lipoprotein YehR (DUF1307 family)
MKKILTLAFIIFALVGCSQQEMAKKFGGATTINLLPQEKFINLTWKGDNIWYIVQDTITGQIYAKEQSSYGILEGRINIKK